MDKLKPCPFCGNNDITSIKIKGDYPEYDTYAYECEVCLATGGKFHSQINARSSWNTRHNSHNDMITIIADYLKIDRHELGNSLQEMQAKAMIERGEIDDQTTD